MKKYIIGGILLMCNILWMPSYAQESTGIGDIIYVAQEVPSTSVSNNGSDILSLSSITIQEHLQLANIATSKPGEGGELAHLQQVQELVKDDIIQQLQTSTDKKNDLQTYLQNTEKAIALSSNDISYFQQNIGIIQMDLNTCTTDKQRADSAYFKAINEFNQQDSDQALQQAIESENCIGQNRIHLNAQNYILNKLQFYTSALSAKYKILGDNQDTIIQNTQGLQKETLQKLIDISTSLDTYTF